MNISTNEYPALSSALLRQFLIAHELPESFGQMAQKHYALLARWVARKRVPGRTMLLGINGAQGTGKSTLADFLRVLLSDTMGWQVAVMSIDDFYLTREQRQTLANTIHPLLRTRGVPGTHDIEILCRYLDKLEKLAGGETLPLPRFNKAQDDRFDPSEWPVVDGPIDLVILEGWCVGSAPQSQHSLAKAVNSLEADQDPKCIWRNYVNAALTNDYARVFGKLHALIFLQAPSFDAVFRWRLEQERKLAKHTAANSGSVMNDSEVANFLQYFEHLTRENLRVMPSRADVVLDLTENHVCDAIRFNSA